MNDTHSSNRGKAYYGGIDFMRMPCALLVLFMHTYCFDWGFFGKWIKYVLSSVGVPFFFIVSGFFFGKRLLESENPFKYTRHYFLRTLKMYAGWTVLVLPVSWYNITLAHSEYGPLMKIMYLIRGFFFSGSLGIYWYLLSLVCNCWIIFAAYKKRWENFLYVMAGVFFIVGVIYEGGFLDQMFLGKAIHVVFGSERNFLMVGLFYMCCGYYLSRHENNLPGKGLCLAGLAASICLKTAELLLLPVVVMQAFVSVFLFMFAIQWTPNASEKTLGVMRRWATAFYLLHFPFILVFDYYLRRGTVITVPVTILFCALVYMLFRKVFPDEIFATLFGR